MAIGYGQAAPKPEKGSSRRKRLTLRLKLGKAFRDAVWARELEKGGGLAYCQVCETGPLLRTLDCMHPLAGHVAHSRGRNVAPHDKFNPDAAVLKCRDCHLREHSQRFA